MNVKNLSLFFLSGFLFLAFAFPNRFRIFTESSLNFIISKFGWFYLLVCILLLAYCIFLTISRFGNIKLGEDGEEPQYSYTSWLAMLFSAGMGIGLVFYGMAEPLAHFAEPPLGQADPKTPQAAFLALRYTFFHWGLHPWAIYAIVGMSLAYFQFRKKDQSLISSLFQPIGLKPNSIGATLIDAISICGVAFGVATSLGLGSLQIHSGLTRLFGLPSGISVTLILIAITTILYLISACTGLDRGIRILSNTNMFLAGFLILFVLFAGPTNFLVELFFTSIGNYLQNFLAMSFRMAPFTDSTWLQDWTLFYWAWWISWAPFVGTFIARISRGRTIREFMIGTLLVPTIISAIWFSILGGTGIYLEMFNGIELVANSSTDPSSTLFLGLENLPLGNYINFLAIVLVLIFFVTSADSATFVLGMMASKGIPNPTLVSKLIWGSIISLIASGLLLNGGLNALQTLAIIISLPFAFLLFLLMFSIHKALLLDLESSKGKKNI